MLPCAIKIEMFGLEINFNLEGNINSYEFFEAIINSHKRLTYNQIEDGNNLNIELNIKNSISAIKDLTKKLAINRINRCIRNKYFRAKH